MQGTGSILARTRTIARRRLALAAVTALAMLSLAATASPVRADCTCRLGGDSVPLGTTACMAPAGAPALYRCAMNLNLTTWQKVGEICPSAHFRLLAPDPHQVATARAPGRTPAADQPEPPRISFARAVIQHGPGARAE